MSADKLSHLDEHGRANMVDVGEKPDSLRTAKVRGEVVLQPETIRLIREGLAKKGDVPTVAQIAGIQAAKRTSELIPLCHPIPIHKIDLDLMIDDDLPGVQIEARLKTVGKTGIEMEAMTAVAVAGLTVYDMVKAVDRTARIQNIRLVEKHGGQSGDVISE